MFHKDYERKINQLVNELTLEEKIKMIHGAGRLLRQFQLRFR